MKKPSKYLQNAQRSDDKIKKKKVHKIPTGNDLLMKELNDVMSQSSSNPYPDLHPMPESSCSEAKSPALVL